MSAGGLPPSPQQQELPVAPNLPAGLKQSNSSRSRRSIEIGAFDFDFDKDGKVDPFEQKVLKALKRWLWSLRGEISACYRLHGRLKGLVEPGGH